MGSRTHLILVAGLATAAVAAGATAFAACDRTPAERRPASTPITSQPPSASPSASEQSATACSTGGPWDCEQQRRFSAASAFLAKKPGKLAVIIHDRTTNAVWRAGTTRNTTWTASTIKLAIAATLLEWNREGTIALDSTDRSNISAALVSSSNDATTALWSRYGGTTMFNHFRQRYGMESLAVVSGYELFWRNLRCSAEDLYRLMLYVLTDLPAADRDYLVGRLRGVASNQRWGVWAAGPNLQPGNKNGWAQKPDQGGTRWVTHSVGFAGQNQRYVVVVTYSMTPSGSMSGGIHTVSDLVATIFGTPVPASITLP
ncbi:MAG: hypothetical protein JXA67_17130 [Micromonosporaceae bacterium]|nr:hypothetical protein [Micromonosporaceae bacterium]